jgi:RNA polymerase sigma-B factor
VAAQTTQQDNFRPAAGPDSDLVDRSRAELSRRLLTRASKSRGAERKRLHDEVVTLNMDVAKSIALRYRDRGEPNEDLLQVAYLGLLKAVRGFDPAFGKDFLSYAVPTISGEVKRYFRDCAWAVRPTRSVQELQAKISAESATLAQKLRRSPTSAEIASHLGVEEDRVIEAMSANGCFTPTSIDAGGDGETAAIADRLGGEDRDMGRAEARLTVEPLFRELPPRDRRIVELRFFRGYTQEQIAKDIGVTQMQVSRLLTRILANFRTQLAA